MSVEVGDGAVIPDYVIGLLDFGAELQLSGNDLFRQCGDKSAVLHQTMHLRRMRRSDHDNPVKLGLNACFKK